MKVVLLTPSNIAGGAERVLSSLANQFAASKLDTWFIQFDKNSNFYNIEEGVHKAALEIEAGDRRGISKWILFPEYYNSLKRMLQKIEPDVVISFLFLTNVVGVICCRNLKIPIILSERNDPGKYNTVQKKIMNLIYPKCNGMVCQSAVVADRCKKDYKIRSITVISNPITKDQVGEYIPNKTDNILAVGRFIPQKNFRLLIDAFSEIIHKYPSKTLTIYGDGPLRSELENLIVEKALEDKIFLPGIESNPIKRHSDSCLFIMSSKFEGYPNVLAEAMANGMTCIAPNVPTGTINEMISHGVNGYIYPVDSKEQLITCINRALSNKEESESITKEAREIYKKIMIDNISGNWIEFIYSVLGKEEKHNG